MDGTDRERIVMARSLMWQEASGEEQAEWLRRADEVRASLTAAAEAATWQWPSEDES